jgi:hypothetical protein
MLGSLLGHLDLVWDVTTCSWNTDFLATASADRTVRIFDTTKTKYVRFTSDSPHFAPFPCVCVYVCVCVCVCLCVLCVCALAFCVSGVYPFCGVPALLLPWLTVALTCARTCHCAWHASLVQIHLVLCESSRQCE